MQVLLGLFQFITPNASAIATVSSLGRAAGHRSGFHRLCFCTVMEASRRCHVPLLACSAVVTHVLLLRHVVAPL